MSQNIKIRTKTSSSFSIYWEPYVFPEEGNPVDYAVKYRQKGGKFLRPTYTENKLQFTINDLQADTEYEVLVFASSENGEDTLLGKALLQTECFQDKKIITIESKVDIRAKTTSSNISLSWDAFVFPDGEVPVDYAVKYRPKGGKFLRPTYTENKLQFTINDLQADTEYEVLVFASSENGEDTLLGKALLQTECFQDKKIITTKSKVDIRANSTSSNISLSWDAFVFPDGEVPVDYAVKYRPKGGKFLRPTYTENKLQFTINDLQADTEYEVLVLTSSESGQGTLICKTMLKTKCSEEKQPLSSANSKIETESTSNSFSICWKDFVCTDGNVPGCVNIKYKAKDSERWLVHQCNKNEFQVTIISNVRDDTEYEVKLFALNENATETLLETILIKTKSSLCRELISCSTKKEAKGHSYKHNVYSLNPTRIEVKRMGVRCCFFGSEKPVAGGNDMVKTILVFGETGAGKSTLIDAMFNYLAGVSHGDDFRFQLVHLTDDEKKKENIIVLSKTDGITCYHVPQNQAINFHLKIIDTPGFNDTRGKQFDKILPKQLENLFNENIIDSIDAICLVVPTAGARYIDSQKHDFDSFRELFAKDVEANIIAILTHDDGASGKPKVLQVIQEAGINIDDGSYFRFNNANLFSQKSSLEEWEKRNRSFQMFFKKLCAIDPISLHHTKEVLKSRGLLEIEIENIRESIKTQFIKKNRKDMEISLSSLDTLLLSAGRHIEKLSKLALRPSITSLDEIFTSIENDEVREQDKDEKQILRNMKQLKRQGKSLLEMMNSI